MGFEVSFAVDVGLCYMFVAWLLHVLLIARLWLFLVVICVVFGCSFGWVSDILICEFCVFDGGLINSVVW